MAGRPRQYATAAERTAAYRSRQGERLVMADRTTFEQTQALLTRLIVAVNNAATAGNALARSLDTRTKLDLLATLAAHFEGQA